MRSLGWSALMVGSAISLAFACSPSDTVKGSGSGPGAGAGGVPIPIQCDEHCTAKHPVGKPIYDTLRACQTCGACFDICNFEIPKLCGEMDMEKGCSGQFPDVPEQDDCSACANSTCAVEQLPDTTFLGICAAEGAACGAEMDCVGMNNCVVQCINDGGPPGGSGGAGGAGGAMGAGGMTAGGGA